MYVTQNLELKKRISNIYTIEDKIFNIDLHKYIEEELQNIFNNVFPYEIVKNIIENMNLNYQWIKIRKKYDLKNTPINLDFNINNYQDVCNKYLTNLTIVFIFTNYHFYGFPEFPILYFLYSSKLVDHDNINNEIDIIYSLNYESCYIHSLGLKESICINNLTLEEISKWFKTFENGFWDNTNIKHDFIDDVIKSKMWRNYKDIDIEFLWDEREKKEINLDIDNRVIKSKSYLLHEFLYTLDNYNYNKNNYINLKNIILRDFIKIISLKIWPNMFTNLWDFPWTAGYGIIIDNTVAFSGNNIMFIIKIDFEGNIEIVEIKDLSELKKVNILDFVKKYGNILLK